MEHLIDKVLEIYKLKQEIDKEVHTCEVCSTSGLTWHILGFEPFVNVAKTLNGGKFNEVDTGSGPYRWRYEFECRGVTVFCLTDGRVEVPTDANDR